MIDPHKPLRFRMPDMRPVRLIGILADGDLVIETTIDEAQSRWGELMRFRADTGRIRGREQDFMAPTLVNDIVVDSGFYAMDDLGPMANTRGLISAKFLFDEYKNCKYALEIVRHDGVPTEAIIHRRP